MDLTPKKSSSAPWWSVFDCCRPPPAATTAADDQDDGGYSNEEFAAAPYMYSIKIATEGGAPQTPGTSCSDDSADVSLESREDDDLAEEDDDVSAPPEISRVVRKLEDDFTVGEHVHVTSKAPYSYETSDGTIKTKEEVAAKTNDPCEEAGLLDETTNPAKGEDLISSDRPEEEEDDEIPDVNFPLTKPPTRVKNTSEKSTDGSNGRGTEDNQAVEIRFYQFMFLMMMRHMFGNFLSGTELDPTAKLLLGQCSVVGSSDEEEELRKRMGLRRLRFFSGEGSGEESLWEVVPKLSSDEGV